MDNLDPEDACQVAAAFDIQEVAYDRWRIEDLKSLAADNGIAHFDSGAISGLGMRNIGSAAMSGRVAALAAMCDCFAGLAADNAAALERQARLASLSEREREGLALSARGDSNKLIARTRDGGASWTTLETVIGESNWTAKTFSLSPSADNKVNIKVRFTLTGQDATNHAYIDNVAVTGVSL